MSYRHIARYVFGTPWAIEESMLIEFLSVLLLRGAGHAFSAEEIKARIGDGGGSSSVTKRGAIAVIPIRGVIAHRMSGMEESSGGTSAESIGRTLTQIAADPGIGTIVYDIDSPGGTVPGIQELADQIFALRGQKKQIAQVNSLAASAAYWLASQCDEIISIPSGTAGSIGVYTAHDNMAKALELAGHDLTLISAGKYKLEGNPFEPLTAEAKAVLQARVDTAMTQFVRAVARGRGVSQTAVRDGYGQGRALDAKDAQRADLIDSIEEIDPSTGVVGRLVGRTSPGALKAEGEPSELEPEPPRSVHPDGDDPDVDGLVARDAEEIRMRRRRLF